ncbi:MAG: ATPase domain-containing protein, partial [Promethearchaeota archaeon]
MDLHEILGVNEHQILTPNRFITFSEFQKTSQFVLPSGSRNFDEILEGGFHSSKKYLIYGANKTGKTQLCHQLCIQAYKYFIDPLDEKNNRYIFYFDTENTFRPERIEELARSTEFKINNILKRILVSKIMSNSALLLALEDSESIIAKN